MTKPVRDSMIEPLPTATDQEAAAVAKAVGLPNTKHRYGGGAPLSKTISARSDVTSDAESPSPTGPMSPDIKAVVLKSPTLKALDSPNMSESEEEDIVDKFSRTKRTTSKQPGKAVGAVVDEVVPKKPPKPPNWDPNDAGQNILDMLDELTG